MDTAIGQAAEDVSQMREPELEPRWGTAPGRAPEEAGCVRRSGMDEREHPKIVTWDPSEGGGYPPGAPPPTVTFPEDATATTEDAETEEPAAPDIP